jgi:NAD(P)-dependent dehydrogenase (short-subunit alcohol dehydrogenase family)
MSHVIVVIGAGSIGQAIARRVSAGKHVVLADLRQQNADAAAEVLATPDSRSARRPLTCRLASRCTPWSRPQRHSATSPA